MNNNLNLSLLITIVAKAMKDNFTITVSYGKINIFNTEDNYIALDLYEEIESKNSYIEIETDRGKDKIENITEEDILRYKLLLTDCEKYEKAKLVEGLNNFFKEAEKEVPQEKTINDLDNEDE